MAEYFWMVTTFVLATAMVYNALPKRRRRLYPVLQSEQYAVNILINTDLDMQRGKVVSQACHAISGILAGAAQDSEGLNIWKSNGEAKIVLKASREDIAQVVKNAKSNGVNVYKVYDAGRTQVLPGSNTAVAIGPAPKSILTVLTGHLKLY